MALRTMQPSEYEIQREVEALRDIRRRSTTPGALTIDPDLPNQPPPSSPTGGYRAGTPPTASTSTNIDADSSNSSNEDGSSSSDLSSNAGTSSATSENPSNPADDPFHLFWVPASLHPEIAPAEFRAFLKEHARAPAADGSAPVGRSNSVTSLSPSSSLGRKKSMLSRQYRPSENDGLEDETIVPLRRNRSTLYTNQGPQLTISDLQKLEVLAEEASTSDDPSKLRSVLRRSLSMNMSPSALEQMDDMPEMGDEADAPIIVPPPGLILRRAARTKIRKPSLPGDGGGHRFGASRRGVSVRSSTTPMEPRTSSDMSSSEHDHDESLDSIVPERRRTFSDERLNDRPDSFSEEVLIYDAYARDEDEELPTPDAVASPQESIEDLSVVPPSPSPSPPPQPEVQTALLEALGPILHQPQPQHLVVPQPSIEPEQPSRTPSPPEATPTPPLPESQPATPAPHAFLSSPPPSPHQQRKDKDKKGLFGKWGGDKTTKRTSKDKERDTRERVSAEKEKEREKEKEKEKEKESGFFGSFFGGGSTKKKQDDAPSLGVQGGASGRETAQALLGASKSSKSYVPPTSPGPPGSVTPNNYSRYPIHVERAIYRLSHIKLANPRRPLYEQVLISNLMFWYLGVINKAQNPTPAPTSLAGTTGAPIAQAPAEAEKMEKEQREREQRERAEKAEKERVERERAEKEQREREIEMKKKESGRRGSLTKAPAPGSPGGGRRAEMPVKGPQYEMQHRVMEQEYGGFNGPATQGMGRSTSTPPGNGNGNGNAQHYPKKPSHHALPKLTSPQTQSQVGEHSHRAPEPKQGQQRPPGVISSSPHRYTSSPPPSPATHRRSRSPPGPHNVPLTSNRYNSKSSLDGTATGGAGRIPGRSLSATAVSSSPPPQMNGKARKGVTTHIVAPQGRRPQASEGKPEQNGIGEEEDMPLAVWQQQRRR